MPRPPSESRKRIVEAALKLFATQGYHNTGIADILKESGVKKGSLYHYFSSKKELGLAAIDEMARLLRKEGAARHLLTDAHPIDRMLKMIDDLPGIEAAKGRWFEPLTPSIAVHLGAAEPEFRERISTLYLESIGEIEAVLRRGVAEGQIVQSVDPRAVSSLFAVTCEGVQFTSVMGLPQALWDDARALLKEYLNSFRR